jgi:hypothetical protein
MSFGATTKRLIAISHNVVMAIGIAASAVDSVIVENAVSQIVSCAISAISHDISPAATFRVYDIRRLDW